MLDAANGQLDLAGADLGLCQVPGNSTAENRLRRRKPPPRRFGIATEKLDGLTKDAASSKKSIRFVGPQPAFLSPAGQRALGYLYDVQQTRLREIQVALEAGKAGEREALLHRLQKLGWFVVVKP